MRTQRPVIFLLIKENRTDISLSGDACYLQLEWLLYRYLVDTLSRWSAGDVPL